MLDLFGFGGVSGVAFFFVLSGLLMYKVHCGDVGVSGRPIGFLKKRLIRIYPTYWLIFILVSISALFSIQTRSVLPDSWLSLIQALLLIPQVTADGLLGVPVLSVAWTLQFEVLFYLAFSVALLGRKWLIFIVFLYFSALVTQFIGYGAGRLWQFLGSPISLLFLMGVVGGILCERDFFRKFARKGFAFGVAAAISGTVVGVYLDLNFWAWYFWGFYGLVSVLILVCLLADKRFLFSDGAAEVAGLLGNSSYALYLLHFPIVAAACKIYFALQFPVSLMGAMCLLAITYVFCCVASVWFYVFIEKPMLRFIKKKLG